MGAPRIVLASRSPQRKAILEQLGIEFEVVPSNVDELRNGPPETVVLENALRKARAVTQQAERDALVIGVDTEVHLDDRVLGKAADEQQAREHLRLLDGRTHEVFGGVALIDAGGERTGVARTSVTFRGLGESLVEWYLARGEWHDRAGAYAIQGYGTALVERVEGDYWNVVGLPVPLLLGLEPGLLGG